MPWVHSFQRNFRYPKAPLAVKFAVIVELCMLLLLTNGQPGFLSINCGSTQSYIDSNNISWVPDDDFISTGVNANILETESVPLPLQTLRYFPGNETKNCYVIPVSPNQTYLVRAGFLYGNYDRRAREGNVLPSFDLLFDSTLWNTISISKVNETVHHEIIIAASRSSFSICVARINTSGDDPFISSLEIREFVGKSDMYALVHDDWFFYTNFRINFGVHDSSTVRYPDDPYDRIWDSDFNSIKNISTYDVITTDQSVSILASYDQPPSRVMMTARSTFTEMNIDFNLHFGAGIYYNALYFAEIQNLSSRDNRIFDIYLNEMKWYEGLNVYERAQGSFKAVEIFGPSTNLSGSSYLLQLEPEAQSTKGPILNAAESYLIQKVQLGTSVQDVQALEDIKISFNLTGSSGDPCLPIPYLWSWIQCSNSTPARVTALLLSNKSLNVMIPNAIANLTELTKLDLSNNHLTGMIPPSLANLPKLQHLYLQNNNLTGSVPEGLQKRATLILWVSGNIYLCSPFGNASCKASPAPSPEFSDLPKTHSHVVLIVGGVMGGLVIGIGIAFTMIFCQRSHHESRKMSLENSGQWPPVAHFTGNSQSLVPLRSFCKKRSDEFIYYSSMEIRSVTNTFEKKMGEGIVGQNFSGTLSDGQDVVVKVLHLKLLQGADQLLNEVKSLVKVHHKNLLNVSGYCAEQQWEMLVFDYMPNGSFGDHLFGPKALQHPLDWKTRLNIALQAAQGLEYLHTACNPIIIHGNVKSTNILLDDKLEAKVTEFGLFRYFTMETLTEKSDVYSFGIVLLEMIFGRPQIDSTLPKEQWNIADWARTILQNSFEQFVDTVVHGYNASAMSKVAQIAFKSTEPEDINRPTMGEVVVQLKEAIKAEAGYHVAFAESTCLYFKDEFSPLYIMPDD